jgi:hypothetical protein
MVLPEPKTMSVVPAWVEQHCIVPDGFRKGRNFRLYDWQLLYLANFYLVRGDAVWVPDDPILGPAFVFRRGMMVGPQKLGKDPHAAAHICVEAVGPALFAGWAGDDDGYVCADHGCRCGWEFPYLLGEPMGMRWPTPLIQITAVSEEQTENTYDALRPMIDDGPLHDLIPKTGEEFIRLPGGGEIATVTSAATSRLGQRVTFVSQGEVGIWLPSNRMVKVADTQYRGLAGMGGRASLNTNAWDPSENSVAQQQFESSAKDIYRQFVQPPKHLSYKNKRQRRKIHEAVYPAEVRRENGGHVDLDAIEAEAADLAEKDVAQAERFFGNRIVTGQSVWMDETAWSAQAANIVLGKKEQVALGFDGSLGTVASRRKPDATCLGASRISDGHLITLHIDEADRPDEHGLWTWEPDRAKVDQALDEAFERFDVLLLWADPQHWQNDVGRWAVKYGSQRVLERWTNNDDWMSRELERLFTAVMNGDVTHDGDADATRHVLNAQRYTKRASGSDPDEKKSRVLVSKKHRNSPDKIDMVPTWVLAYAARAHVLEKGLNVPVKPVSSALLTHKVKAR